MIDWLRRDMLEPEIELGGRKVPIVLRRHKGARRLTLRLAPDASEVRLTLPQWARSAEAIAFAHARREWLEGQAAKIPQRRRPRPGGRIPYRGRELLIDWQAGAPRTPHLQGEAVALGGPETSIERRLQRWLEAEARAHFAQDIAHYCARANLDPVPLALSRAQKRWGSCSDRQTIRINWRLIQAPDHVRRSVVAHEVTHLVHFDHSPAFHAMLGELFEENIADADRWLKEKGRTLYASFG